MNKLPNEQMIDRLRERQTGGLTDRRIDRQGVVKAYRECGCERLSQIYERRVKSGATGEYPH